MGRKQQDTLFSFSVSLDFEPGVEGEEAGVSAFLTQNHHMDLGVVMLPAGSETGSEDAEEGTETEGGLIPYFRFRAESYEPVPETLVVPVPENWAGETLRLEISGNNYTHFSFSAGPAERRHEARTFMEASSGALSWGFTGTCFFSLTLMVFSCLRRADWAVGVILGAYATTNGGEGSAPAYISEWKYVSHEQFTS